MFVQREATGRAATLTPMTDTLEQIRHKIDGAVDVNPEHGRYRGRREAFTDPVLFELEMK